MPYIHHTESLAYLATPRTASRATAQALEKIGFEKVGSHHGGLEHLKNEIDSIATTIRDPVDVLASWTRRNKKPSMTPAEIVRQEILTNEWVWRGTCASFHVEEADVIMRYEDGIEPELQRWLPQALSVSEVPQVGTRQKGAGGLTSEQRSIIKEYTKDERKKLGYI